jgi:hypothetical protein
MNFRASRMIPPVQRPQIFGILAVLVFFILVEFAVGEHDKVSAVSSGEAQTTTTR